jgi:hypothetical protein
VVFLAEWAVAAMAGLVAPLAALADSEEWAEAT